MNKNYPDGIDIKAEVLQFVDNTSAKIKPKGNEYEFEYCPFCNGGQSHDKNTFAINYMTGQYQCKRASCSEKGNLWTLTKDSRFDYSLPEPEKKEIRKHTFTFKTNSDQDESAEEWIFKNRGIPKEITKKYKVKFGDAKFKRFYNADGNMILSKPSDFLVWQFTDPTESRTRWYKFRRTNEGKPKEWGLNKEFTLDGKKYNVEPCLFGMGECDYRDSFVILTEGQFDTLAVAAAGYGNVVSVPTGAGGMKWFDDEEVSKNFLKRFKELIVFGDKDGNEITLFKDMQKRFKGKIKRVRLEDYKDCKDANEILQKYGIEQIQECIKNAESVPIKGLKKMKDVEKVNMSSLPRIKTGIDPLDDYLLGFFFGQVITVTGRSGDGKTTLTSQFVASALSQSIPTVIYSGEFPDWMIKNWLVLQLAGPDNVINSPQGTDVTEKVYQKIESWKPFAEECYIYEVGLDLDESEEDCNTMLDTISDAILQAGVRLIVIDNLMTAMDFSGDNDLNKAQSVFMKQLKSLALLHEVIILVVAHPKKTANEITKEDIAGSSNIGNLSDTIISYSKPDGDVDYQRDISILKNRWNNDKGVGVDPIHTYFNESSKRISTSKVFDWFYGWEGFVDANMDEIPY